jgi:hypothetical protein
MTNTGRYTSDFEKTMKEYLKQGKDKLTNDLAGTREAIRLIANDKMKDFLKTMDKGLDKCERDYLSMLIVSSMYQSFCYGYGIGKIEGNTKNKVML